MLRRLAHNWPAKLLSLLAALLVWFVVSAGQQRAGTFPGGIPLAIENVPDGFVAISDVADVQVTLLADRVLWQRFTADQFTASVSASGLAAGVADLPITVGTQLSGVEITKIEPERVLVRLEPVEEKVVPITVRIDGQAADGFAPGEAVAEPALVTLRGPKSQLDHIETVTGTLRLAGQRREFEEVVPVSALVAGQPIDQVTVRPEQVKVRVPIARAGNVKTVGVSVATSGALPSGFVITSLLVKPSVVTITGETSAVAATSTVSTEPIDLTDIRQTTEVTVPLHLPSGVKLIDDIAGEAAVTIRLEEAIVTRSFEVPVTVVSSKRTVRSVTPSIVTVVLSGPLGVLLALDTQSVQLMHPLDTPSSGSQTVALTLGDVIHPPAVSVGSLSPTTVHVELE